MNNNNNLEQQFNDFNQQFSGYMLSELNEIAVETVVNYIPLRNHMLSVMMLENDEMYDSYSESETLNWKNNFLTTEQEQEHICLMSSEFQQKCFDWINSDDNSELNIVMTSTFGEELSTDLFDMFCLNIWRNYIGDCMSVKVK
jgi:hypothetical protein